MLRSLKDLESYKVSATDGDVGRVTDFLFDDQYFTIRYLVTNTSGFWEGPNQVLISPISFRGVDWEQKHFNVSLTQEKVKNSPGVDLAKPVSRQYERDYSQYYGWPYYWGLGATWAWGMGSYPAALIETAPIPAVEPVAHDDTYNDPHLRSAREVTGYNVHASDGEIGHVADFIVDDETWTLRYLVIDTSNWWFGKKVLVAPHWVREVSWPKNMVYVDLSMESIKNSPLWKPEELLNRDYEERLYNHYGRPAYWTRSEDSEKAHVRPPSPDGPLERRA